MEQYNWRDIIRFNIKKVIYMSERKKNVCGQPCEVYSRVVGYYRPVQNWNKGKTEEYKERKVYNSPEIEEGGDK